MTMKTLRERQRAERLAYVEGVLAEAGSVRKAAKLADMRRPHFIRLRNALFQYRDILTDARTRPTP